jgi:hypothetical protein
MYVHRCDTNFVTFYELGLKFQTGPLTSISPTWETCCQKPTPALLQVQHRLYGLNVQQVPQAVHGASVRHREEEPIVIKQI